MARREVDPRIIDNKRKNAKKEKHIKAIDVKGNVVKRKEFISDIDKLKVNRELERLVPGTPTQDYILLEVNVGDVKERLDHQNQKHKEFLTTIFQIKKVGPDIKNEAIKKGAFVQITPTARMVILEWASQLNVMIREYEIMFLFDYDPKEMFKKEYDLQKSNSAKNSMPLSAGGNA